ncbi:amino acid adenylation domain-containing protein, partial [Paenibacillus macerans]|uniref:amino acid adenylation domain-containing protein n=1 Tax=Paenibacillus macerans TaxID=44252 RepID=UPI003D31DC12
MQRISYPLTHAQKRIWYTEQFYPGTSVSNLSGIAKLKSEAGIDKALLDEAIRHVVRANEALRMRIALDETGEPKQYVAEYRRFEMEWVDICETGDTDAVMERAQTEACRPLPLYDNELYRFISFRISPTEVWFLAVVHHAISDGISMVLLGNQLIERYLELTKGEGAEDAAQPSYVEYIQTETEYEQSARFQKDLVFWNGQFETIPETVSLKRGDSYLVDTEAIRLTEEVPSFLHKKIQAFCQEHGISVLSLFLSLLHIYMSRTTGQTETILGTFMGNRTNAKEKQMLGMFVSTIPVRARVDENADFLGFAKQIMKDQLAVIRHQKYPYNRLITDLRAKHGQVNRLFGVSLEYQVMLWTEKEGISYMIEPLFSGHEVNDMSIHVKERLDTGLLMIDMDYRSECFEPEEIKAFYRRLLTLLEHALLFPERAIRELEWLPQAEQEQLRAWGGGLRLSYDREMTLHSWFELQAALSPERTAVYFEGHTLSYRDLNERANRLGRLLRDKGVVPDMPVAILLERSERAIIAMLGVLKAGGAYVPVDPSLPEERIRYMVGDSGAKFVVTEAELAGKYELPGSVSERIVYEELGAFGEGDGWNLPPSAGSRNLAYIIYTSGTTGKPKGVMIEHRQVRHLIESLRGQVYRAYEPGQHVALLAPFHFDASVQQIYAALLLGHTLYIVPKAKVLEGRTLAGYYRDHAIRLTDGTPAHLNMLSAADELQGVQLRHMLIGGEALPRETVGRLLERLAKEGLSPMITNVYGPTECCVDASAYEITQASLHGQGGSAYLPIGKPLGNNRFYILDAFGRLLPQGVEGELYIAGDGAGRGYWNLPDMTSAKFTADPFVPGDRMYRTGDIAKWLPDGNAEYVSRIDDQVKIRGYRIELGEIEAVLHKHPEVGKAVVLARPEAQGGAELCAYLVWKERERTAAFSELRKHLALELPDYMLPAYYVELDEIPLTASGKIDRRALLAHEVAAAGGTEYVAPGTAWEKLLADLWQEVLGLARVGIYDNFFELGGHSLKAMTLLSRMHKQLGVEVPLQLLFETPTVHALARYAAEAGRKVYQGIEPAASRELYPLSFAQRRIFIVSQLEGAGIGYNMPATAILEGKLDEKRLEEAFRGLIRRHEALRTSFHNVDGVPMQRVHDDAPFAMARAEASEKSAEAMMAAFVRPFELGQAPLMRIGLVRVDERKHVLLFDMHHLISDGVSIGLILQELAALYGGHDLPELRLQYKDYAVWQEERFAAGTSEEGESYWLQTLGGELPVLQLLSDRPRPAVQSFEGDRTSLFLDAELKAKLNRLAEQHGATLYMVLLTAYYALLSRYTGQEDIIVGTPAAGRNHADLEGIVGMFVNTLAIRLKLDRNRTFADALLNVRSQVLQAFEHQSYPFERLVEKLNLPRDLGRNPLFDTMFVLQNAADDMPEIGGLKLAVRETNFRVAKFDLTLQAKEEAGGLALDLDYSTRLFRKETAERMLGHYLNLLRGIADAPEWECGRYDLLARAERQQLLHGFNPGATEYPRDKTIVQLFEEQVAFSPDRPALAFEGTELTYAELNARANRMARAMLARGVGRGAVVAVLAERSVEMIAGIMAILKTGAAYVPIDPEHPAQRIGYFLADSGASLLLTQRQIAPLAEQAGYKGAVLLADDAELDQGEASNPVLDSPAEPGDLANLTYTSGTTGNPKGNMVTHANVLRTVKNSNYMQVTGEDVVLGLSNYVFDAFMFDFFGALLNGAKLVVIPKDVVLDISRLPQVIEQERVSVLMITTALFNLLVDFRPEALAGIRKVLFGGERASVDHVRRALLATGPDTLLHMYGPSESTVFATYYPVNEVPEDAAAIPIGKPVGNTSVYIVDADLQPQPIGAAGELCVGGEGLVLGYLNRPELTAEKFVSHPLTAGGKMYRTGDLARWLPNGNIEFIGRIDHQVKIRGQRIELGEIEHRLVAHEAVREAVVLALETASGEKTLCAYVVAERLLSDGELRGHAAKELPAYMVPAAYVQMPELPLTGNGKLDRRALPKPDLQGGMGSAAYTAPRNETEAKLAKIWQETLAVHRISVNDNFFELGGHSLKAMELLARIHREMRVELPLKALFQAPTIAGVAQAFEGAGRREYPAIPAAEPREAYPVSSAQKRLYVLHQLEGAEMSYNMPSVLRLKGRVQLERFEAALRELVRRHEALRTSFVMEDGELVQCIHEEASIEPDYFEADEREAARIIAAFIAPFDLERAPLFRTALIKLADDDYIWLADMHHIISDGMSVGVLIEEMTALYAGHSLPPLRIQYKDYAVWQQSFRKSEPYRRQEVYWLEQFAGELPVLELPTDYARPAVQGFAGDRLAFTVDGELAEGLRKLAQDAGATLYMVLLASFGGWLAKLSGQDDIVVGSPIAGRPHADLARIMGMFVNTLAIHSFPQGEKSFVDYLGEVKQTLLGAYDSQDYPLEELVAKVQKERDMSRNPLFDAVFAMQNADLRQLAMEGVELEAYPYDHKTAKFDLTLTAAEDGKAIRFEMEYNTSLFKAGTIRRWSGLFQTLLRRIAEHPDARLADVGLLTEAEARRMLAEYNANPLNVPEDVTIHQLFERQVQRTPERPAVTYLGQSWTYRELNARANRLARLLTAKGIDAGQRVGIMVKPS